MMSHGYDFTYKLFVFGFFSFSDVTSGFNDSEGGHSSCARGVAATPRARSRVKLTMITNAVPVFQGNIAISSLSRALVAYGLMH